MSQVPGMRVSPEGMQEQKEVHDMQQRSYNTAG